MNSGFFDIYEEYVFVRGTESHVTCIAKNNEKILFKKDGVEFELGYDDSAKIYRTEYAIYFNDPTEEDSGKYTCYLESDATVTYDMRVRVIGKDD